MVSTPNWCFSLNLLPHFECNSSGTIKHCFSQPSTRSIGRIFGGIRRPPLKHPRKWPTTCPSWLLRLTYYFNFLPLLSRSLLPHPLTMLATNLILFSPETALPPTLLWRHVLLSPTLPIWQPYLINALCTCPSQHPLPLSLLSVLICFISPPFIWLILTDAS